ncbi:hypothetical protein VTL71DRAFT_10740 [Oculimacula yallundae]|uniref:Plasma membrane proteolipid 3 n=1 Tax=Oculimacula yallundae TaxID=86028 RepID=A0ABR4CVC6_9HELO
MESQKGHRKRHRHSTRRIFFFHQHTTYIFACYSIPTIHNQHQFSQLQPPPNTSTFTMAFTASDICKIILAVILPPLGVFLERGCGADLLINILLTILGYIPGIIHALYSTHDVSSISTLLNTSSDEARLT